MSQRFISEADIAANKEKLKEAWSATKGPDDPDQPPDEPPPDNRTLFHKLEEQRLKKQEDYDDAHKLKNMVRGLEDDEIEFLDLVDRTKMEQERRVRNEETDALTEFRKRRAEMELALTTEKVSSVIQTNSTATTPKVIKNSQKSLLMGAIKRKSSDSVDADNPTKKTRLNSSSASDDSATRRASLEAVAVEKDSSVTVAEPPTQQQASSPAVGANGYLYTAGILPGLASYSDSSDSDRSSSSDLEQESRLIIRVHRHKNKKKGGCC